jgi:DNA-binding NarL/FixJ family response regulator
MPWTVVESPARRAGRPPLSWGTPQERAALLRATADAQSALQDAVAAATEAAQHARSLSVLLEQATDVAALRAGLLSGSPPHAVEASDPSKSLSPREREVLALVAEGRSNKAIAAALYVSPNTVKTHVASLLNKLQADSRVQLAAIAARQWCGRTATDGRGG